ARRVVDAVVVHEADGGVGVEALVVALVRAGVDAQRGRADRSPAVHDAVVVGVVAGHLSVLQQLGPHAVVDALAEVLDGVAKDVRGRLADRMVELDADGGVGHASYPFRPLSTKPWMIWRWKIA